MAGDVRVIKAHQWEDYLRCEELQRAICPGGDPPVPAALLRPANEHGGLLLMALLGSEPVGLALGQLALEAQGLYHHSDLVGVLKEHRHRGIGFLLRTREREEVLAQGLHRMTWTLDPLQADHAGLTFRKLGGRCGVYLRDYLGPRGSAPRGGPSGDRLWVEWDLEGRGVLARLQGGDPRSWEPGGADSIGVTAPLAGGFREPRGVDLRLQAPALFLEIPWDLQSLEEEHPDVAAGWGREVRQALEHYFLRHYQIVDLAVDRRYRRAFHVLVGPGEARVPR